VSSQKTVEWRKVKAIVTEARRTLDSKNLLKAELKRRGVTYGQLVEKLAAISVVETERNLNNKISRGGFTAAFMLQCLVAIGTKSVVLG
jgi:Domain of unknown function (DUF6471)